MIAKWENGAISNPEFQISHQWPRDCAHFVAQWLSTFLEIPRADPEHETKDQA